MKLVLFSLFSLLAPGAMAGGESANPGDLAQFCRRADFILHGRVVAQSSLRDDGLIWTSYTLQVTEPLKSPGRAEIKTFQFRQLGGRVGELRQLATGAVYFNRDDEVILFTRDYGNGFQSVAEGERGCMRVRSIKSNKQKRQIVPEAIRLAPGEAAIDLDRLKQQLRDAINKESGKEARS